MWRRKDRISSFMWGRKDRISSFMWGEEGQNLLFYESPLLCGGGRTESPLLCVCVGGGGGEGQNQPQMFLVE